MKLIVILSLFAFSTVFLLVNSFSAERNNLFPAAAIFLIIGGSLLTGSIQIENGTEYQYKTVNNDTVIDQKTKTYQEVKTPIQGIKFSNLLGMLFMIMGAGYIVMAAPGRFRTLLSGS